MKRPTFHRTLFKGWSLVMLAALCTFAVGAGAATAAPRKPPRDGRTLEQVYRQAPQRLAQAERVIVRGERFAARVETFINEAKGRGRDTAALEQALATYKNSLSNARTAWKTAADALAGHAGFDDTGAVTDEAQARATMEKFRTNLEQSGATVKSATRTMREALRTFHRANPGEKLPEPDPEP